MQLVDYNTHPDFTDEEISPRELKAMIKQGERDRRQDERARARAFVVEYLIEGAAKKADIEGDADYHDIDPWALRYAKKKLHIESSRVHSNIWHWRLPHDLRSIPARYQRLETEREPTYDDRDRK